MKNLSARTHALAAGVAAALMLVWAAPALADPPPWAPAHGYRAKKGHKDKHGDDDYRYYRDRVYVAPLSAGLGRCNREAVGTLLGGAVGAAAGSTVGKGGDRTAAIIGGAILGALAGNVIGRSMDEADGYCVAQALAHGKDGETVIWHSPRSDTEYRVTPKRSYQTDSGRYCREYTARAIVGGRREQTYGTACLQPDGSWKLAS
jgi:surface antigen